MDTFVWVVIGLVLLSVVVWAFRDAQIRMSNTVGVEVRDDEDEVRGR